MKTLIRTAVATAALATATAACTSAPSSPAPVKLDPAKNVRLVSYSGCDDLLAGLRDHAADNVGAWGFGGPVMPMYAREDTAQAKTANTPDHSTTNVHEAGVDEPDLVKTDGNRIITVADGKLRVIDTATRKVTATLDLAEKGKPAYQPADLLVSGDRALVLFRGGGDIMYKTFAPVGDTRYVLVDLSGEPKVLDTIKPVNGTFVDARMVGSTVRLVTRSQPDIEFPQAKDNATEEQRKKLNQDAVRKAPLDAWLPKVEITDAAGTVRKDAVKCERVSHPAEYTGTSLLTVHTIDLAQGLGDAGTDPISLAADGDTVYGTGQSLYVASDPQWWLPGEIAKPKPEETEVHRFDVAKPGAPAYVNSGKVPGRLLNQYSLSEFDGNLRIATTLTSPDGKSSASSVYVLDAGGMNKVGEVGGLGEGERIYSVRFIGPVGYCVTFKQMDPLYTLDLRDPAAPKVTGELKITGYSAYLHPAGDGRLIGIGQEASDKGRPLGTQVSLFDVSNPASPSRLSQMFQKESGSQAEWDPHAFLYWPKTGLAVIPLSSYGEKQQQDGAVALKISDSGVSKLGMITHPVHKQDGYSYQPGIQRTMVIGDSVWTVSYDGIQVNDINTLDKQAWIPLH